MPTATPPPGSTAVPGIEDRPLAPWRQRLFEIVFESDTWTGRMFDLILLWAIVLSALAVVLGSVPDIQARFGAELRMLEWGFTALFTLEYLARLAAVGRPLRYATSFFGVVDLLAMLPAWLDLLFPGSHQLLMVRVLRLLRIFRILKLGRYLDESRLLMAALKASRPKIIVFLSFVAVVVMIVGVLMHVIEGPQNGFDSIPRSMYWAIVTLCTVGFGDITPKTPLGQTVASAVMIMGYGVIAVPTGILSVEIARAGRVEPISGQACPGCTRQGHDPDAKHCKFCGADLGQTGLTPSAGNSGSGNRV
ncbi:MAG: ion transporter [Planctomycetes bacterium]|nr:ion transporter [Planctomycetota bacterium]